MTTDNTLRYSSLSNEICLRVSIDAMPARDKIALLHYLIQWAMPGSDDTVESSREYCAAAEVVLRSAGNRW